MNQIAIDQFKNQIQVVLTQLHLFLTWCEEVEGQDKIYEQKLAYIAKQNKQVEANRDAVQKKEQENIRISLEMETQRQKHEALREELLFKELTINKERQTLNFDKNMLQKDQIRLEAIRIDKENFLKQEKLLTEREKKVTLDEQLIADTKERLQVREDQLNIQAKRISDILKK